MLPVATHISLSAELDLHFVLPKNKGQYDIQDALHREFPSFRIYNRVTKVVYDGEVPAMHPRGRSRMRWWH